MKSSLVEKMQFQAVHRLKSGKAGHNMIVRFVSLADKDRVFQAARSLPPNSGHAIFGDLPPILAKRRLHLLEQRKQKPEHERKQWILKYLKNEPFLELARKPVPRNREDESENYTGPVTISPGRGRGRGRLGFIQSPGLEQSV